MSTNKTLALFDFDGTITKKDTFIEFIKFTHGSLSYLLGLWLLSPMLVLYALKLIRNDKAKTIMFKYFYGGWKYERFKKAGEDFCEKKVPALVKKSALEKLKSHQTNGDRVILVTASGKEWVKPWCDEIGIEMLSTEVEIKNNLITGELSSANCYGPEKVNRIKAILKTEDYTTIYGYGDSSGDKEMLALCQHPHYKYFND